MWTTKKRDQQQHDGEMNGPRGLPAAEKLRDEGQRGVHAGDMARPVRIISGSRTKSTAA